MLTLLTALALAQSTATPEPTPLLPVDDLDATALSASLDHHIASFGAEWGEAYAFSGFVMVAQRGEPIYAKGFGASDRAVGVAPGPDTSFRVGSVTKQFTAAAILELEEQGKLSVHDAVTEHVSFPHEVTIHQLLTHTSGVWSYTNDFDADIKRAAKPHTTEEMLAWFADHPLEFEPGTHFRYSNSGYVLLGAVIESVTGKPWADAVDELVFQPAGLERTQVGDGVADDAAKPYTAKGRELTNALPIDMSVPHAAGNVRSTANDLVAWHQALATEAVLDAETKARMFTPARDGYAYGWMVGEREGTPTTCHGGGIFGFNTYFCRVPSRDIVVVAWTNNDSFAVDNVGEAALRFALDLEVGAHVERPEIQLDKAFAKQVRGHYALSEAGRAALVEAGAEAVIPTIEQIEVTYKKGSLILKPIGQGPLELFRTDETTLFTKVAGVEVALEDDGFVLVQGGLSIPYERP